MTVPEIFWALRGLTERLGDAGGVLSTGAVTIGDGRYAQPWARPPAARAQGERTVAELVDDLVLASTGVAYHHLPTLQGGGWVTSRRRGIWAIPAPRLIPLLAILLTLEDG